MSICTAPTFKLESLSNLFIEMTSKNCNQRCNKCYIDFPQAKNIKDFISIEKIRECLNDIKSTSLDCIYLTGAEPMTHPDFNTILRLCLKYSNVCICTNSSFLNEKKIRFLKKVEDEGNNQIFFQLTLAHYDENLSDKIRYRGNYRQTISALKTLFRYDFFTQLIVQNFYQLSNEDITQHFSNIFKRNEIENVSIKINASYPVEENELSFNDMKVKTDCMYGRTLCQSGVYSCPFLANDYRGRLGSSFKDYSKCVNAETDFCSVCLQNRNFLFTIE